MSTGGPFLVLTTPALAAGFSPADLKRLSPTAIRAFKELAAHWHLTNTQSRALLGWLPPSTYSKYLRDPQSATLSFDTLARISHLLGIFKSLNVLFADPALADAWLAKPNTAPPFMGISALAFMEQGAFESIVAVRNYLDSARGW
jgi:hypothetical protein